MLRAVGETKYFIFPTTALSVSGVRVRTCVRLSRQAAPPIFLYHTTRPAVCQVAGRILYNDKIDWRKNFSFAIKRRAYHKKLFNCQYVQSILFQIMCISDGGHDTVKRISDPEHQCDSDKRRCPNAC